MARGQDVVTSSRKNSRRSIAVIGAGISGITAAHILSRDHDVTIYEKNGYLGGHTNTRTIETGPDAGVAVDTGFIVCNDRNYPLFLQFISALGIPIRDAEMSFGFYDEQSGFRYRGPGFQEFISLPSALLSPRFYRVVREQIRFNSRMVMELRNGSLTDEPLAAYLQRHKVSQVFVEYYLLPLIASIWSSPSATAMDFPVATFARFFDNHGMLELSKRPQWKTVIGGSCCYVKAFEKVFKGTVLTNARLDGINRHDDSVTVLEQGGTSRSFDKVVIATHADEALRILNDPSPEEKSCLGRWIYSKNRTVLHTDTSVLPGSAKQWASWNYVRRNQGTHTDPEQSPVSITYDMNRLQGLRTKSHYLVTLNDNGRIDPGKVVYQVEYTHPVYTPQSVAAQDDLRRMNGVRNTFYCGAYLGYGFHEDGVRSAVEVAKHFGQTL